jgi:hypothetical protein
MIEFSSIVIICEESLDPIRDYGYFKDLVDGGPPCRVNA